MGEQLGPETLRALLKLGAGGTHAFTDEEYDLGISHADAWARDRATLVQEHADHTDTLEQLAAAQRRVEALEKVHDAARKFVWAHREALMHEDDDYAEDMEALANKAWAELLAALAQEQPDA